jgi:hypothetical protein
MSEDRDAYLAVEVPLPNGKVAKGKAIGLKKARELILLSDSFTSGSKEALTPLLEEFARVTGITEDYLLELDPELTFGDLIGVMNSFFYWRRPARAAPTNPVLAATPNGGAS